RQEQVEQVRQPRAEQRHLTLEERSYVQSRLIQAAMVGLVDEQGINDHTFRTLMSLATNDRWEETATVAYQVLSTSRTFQNQLRSALPNFSSDYYRAKADLFLARATHNGADRALGEARAHLEQDPSLTELQRRHERYFLNHGAREGNDPLNDPFQDL